MNQRHEYMKDGHYAREHREEPFRQADVGPCRAGSYGALHEKKEVVKAQPARL